jgi:hypothetical protein
VRIPQSGKTGTLFLDRITRISRIGKAGLKCSFLLDRITWIDGTQSVFVVGLPVLFLFLFGQLLFFGCLLRFLLFRLLRVH